MKIALPASLDGQRGATLALIGVLWRSVGCKVRLPLDHFEIRAGAAEKTLTDRLDAFAYQSHAFL